MLNRQVGAVKFDALKPFFLTIYQSSRSSLSTLPLSVPDLLPLNRNWQEKEVYKLSPVTPYRYDALSSIVQLGLQATTAGRFADALSLFKRLLHSILMTSTTKKSEVDEMIIWVKLAREYIIGLSLELCRKELSSNEGADNLKRCVELSAYFTHCQLDPKHVILSLNLAMAQAYKLKCFQSASVFVRRLLELGPDAQIVTRVIQSFYVIFIF